MKAVTEAVKQLAKERRTYESAPQSSRDPLACHADDCPCRGTVDISGSGNFFCSWHAGIPTQRWPEVTDALHKAQWLLDAIGEIHRLSQSPKHSRAWLAQARVLFANDEQLLPTGDFEQREPNAYIWRLRKELTYRCGNRPDRVAPRVPQAQEPGFARRPMSQTEAVDGAGFSPVPGRLLAETPLERQARIKRYAEEHGVAP